MDQKTLNPDLVDESYCTFNRRVRGLGFWSLGFRAYRVQGLPIVSIVVPFFG